MTLEYFQNNQTQSQQQQRGNGNNSPYNRYVPPTFNWGRGGLTGNQPQYDQMVWNQMRGFNLPTQDGRTSGPNQYMSYLQNMLNQFGSQYGDPNRRPTVPQFGPYGGAGGGEGLFFQNYGRDGRGGGGFSDPEGFNPFNPYARMPRDPRMTQDDMMPAWFEQMFGRGGLGSLTPNSRYQGVGSGDGTSKDPNNPYAGTGSGEGNLKGPDFTKPLFRNG